MCATYIGHHRDSLWIHFYKDLNNRNEQTFHTENLSTQQLVGQRLAASNLNDRSLDNLIIDVNDELNFDVASKQRFKRDLHQFNLPTNIDLGKVWSNEDESLKEKLINTRFSANYEFMQNDDQNLVAAKKTADKDTLELPLASSSPIHSQTRSTRHRSHHQKRRLTTTTTTEQSTDQEQSSVEFFAQPSPQQTAGGSNDKVWLNSYSRVPLPALQEFCASATQHCSNKGGGLKGDKGDRGLDGRDGLPGVGIDGVNGRDGLPGVDGLPGRHGEKGKDGKDGKPGEKGMKGDSGKDGRPGEKGIKGKAGTPGTPGENGLPGLIAWNLTQGEHTTLLFPVSFVDNASETKRLQVKENFKLAINCSAIGSPPPTYNWDKVDSNTPILFNNRWLVSGIGSEQLIFNPVRRDHSGLYRCSANNGLPRPIERLFEIDVLYQPQINITHVNLSELHFELDANPPANFEIIFESNLRNEPINKRVNAFKVLHQERPSPTRTSYLIRFAKLSEQEMGDYSIIARNSVNTTYGQFRLQTEYNNFRPKAFGLPMYQDDCACGQDSFSPAANSHPINSLMKFSQNKFSKRADECVVNGKLKELTRIGIPLYFGELNQEWGSWMMDNYMNRTIRHPFDSTVTNSLENNENKVDKQEIKIDEEKVYMTNEKDTRKVYEYANKQQFCNQNVSSTHELTHSFTGNSQLIYNNYLVYQTENTYKILKNGLSTQDMQGFDLLNNFFTYEPKYRLFSTQHNQIHLLADENGLWAIMAYDMQIDRKRKQGLFSSIDSHKSTSSTAKQQPSDSGNPSNLPLPPNYTETNEILNGEIENTIIIKFQPLRTAEDELRIEKVISLKNIDNRKYGTMFIVCGVLYGLDSIHASSSKISFAFDLYEERFLSNFSPIPFTNPFQANNFLTYNSRFKKIFGKDHSTLIEYPILQEVVGS